MTKFLQKYKKSSILIFVVAAVCLSGAVFLAKSPWQSVSVAPVSKCANDTLHNTITDAHNERSALRAAYVVLLRESSEKSARRNFNLFDTVRMRSAVNFHQKDGVNAVCSKRIKYVDTQKNLVSSRVDELIPTLQKLEIAQIKKKEDLFVLCSFLEAITIEIKEEQLGYSIVGPAMQCLTQDVLDKNYRDVW